MVTAAWKRCTGEPWRAVLPLPLPGLCLSPLPILVAWNFSYTKHVSEADGDSARLLFWREKSSVVV